ncbi:MAG: hypothetical protein CML29_15975 [Rhizobiales bacterium]|nr:hypothetical protein [Hyphomicrobiales bacterium]MBA70281.1 hypothetical protein [Hyphomicrobiales bacterium]
MKRFGKFLALLAVSASTIVALPAAPAFAGGEGIPYANNPQRHNGGNVWRHRDGRNWHNRHHNRRYYGHYRDRDRGNSAAALGLGLAIGAVTAGAIASSRAPSYSGGSLEPWTRDWYRYCDNRYRSFNPDTGTYRGFDGRDHFCRAP